MRSEFLNYFRCSAEWDQFAVSGALDPHAGHFDYAGVRCYGRRSQGTIHGGSNGSGVALPFVLSEVVANLQQERYFSNATAERGEFTSSAVVRAAYYSVRPILPVHIRKHLQKLRLNGWQQIEFPRWPVDFSVDTLMRDAMRLAMRHRRVDRVPFVWFWPDGARGCGIITHDVEAKAGRDFCGRLMDLNDSYGFKSAFEVVPEVRYDNPQALCSSVRDRGFEVNVHDLNHDGHLFQDKRTFLERVKRINEYGREFGSRGFRAAAMYRNQCWFGALEFSYDLSVPNVAHLEPQRGGCCTVMPYFVGDLVELPLTTIQDYSLFHILNNYSTDIWKQQIELILERNGLITVLTHPDYLINERARAVYGELLAYLQRLRDDGHVWFPLPRDVDVWWRNRDRMTLVEQGGRWRVQGPDSDRARVAYATLDDGRLVYEIEH